jgi:hypothetical protein
MESIIRVSFWTPSYTLSCRVQCEGENGWRCVLILSVQRRPFFCIHCIVDYYIHNKYMLLFSKEQVRNSEGKPGE